MCQAFHTCAAKLPCQLPSEEASLSDGRTYVGTAQNEAVEEEADVAEDLGPHVQCSNTCKSPSYGLRHALNDLKRAIHGFSKLATVDGCGNVAGPICKRAVQGGQEQRFNNFPYWVGHNCWKTEDPATWYPYLQATVGVKKRQAPACTIAVYRDKRPAAEAPPVAARSDPVDRALVHLHEPLLAPYSRQHSKGALRLQHLLPLLPP